MAGKGKIQSGTFGSLPKTKQQQQQPTVFEQKKAAEDEKKYQQAYKTTGVSRTAYNNINKKKSASSSSTTTKKKSTASRASKTPSSSAMTKRSPAARFDTKTGAINLSNGTAIGGHTDTVSPTARFTPTVKDIVEKNYSRAKNTTGISRAAYEALKNSKKKSTAKQGSVPYSSMYSLPSVQKEIILRPEKTRAARRAMNDKYGINADSFKMDDFKKWADKHGVVIDNNFGFNINENWSRNADRQTLDDAHKLLALAKNNQKLNMGTGEVFATHALDSATFGISTAADDYIRRHEALRNGSSLLYEPTANRGEYMELNRERHPVAAFSGEVSGALAAMAATYGFGSSVAGIKALASTPAWVRAAVAQGVSFGLNEGLQTAGHGGSAKEVAVNALTGGLAGAVGGGVQSKVGGALENVLFNKGLQNKIAPEIARNAISSASDAAAQNTVKYVLYSKDDKPTLEEATQDILVAFAFGAMYSAKDTIALSKKSKTQLDALTDRVSADYQALVQRANSSYAKNGGLDNELNKLAGNINEYSRAVRDYLDGVGYYGYIDGAKVDLEPGARFVGADKQVRAMRDSLDTIIERTAAIQSDAARVRVPRIGSGSAVAAAADDAYRTGLNHASAVKEYQFTKRLAEATGAEVNIRNRVFEPNSTKEVNGYADVANKSISASRNADFGISPAQVTAHEGGHIAAVKAPEKFEDYKNTALDAAVRNNGAALDDYIQSLKSRGYTPEQIDEELAAELTAPFADSQEVINALAADSPQFVRRGLETISRIKATLKDLSGQTYTMPNGLKFTYRDIDEMGIKYARALRAAGGGEEGSKSGDNSNSNKIFGRFSRKAESDVNDIVELFYRDVKKGRIDGIDNAELPKSQLRERISEGKQLIDAALNSSDSDTWNAAYDHFISIAEDIVHNSYMYSASDADIYNDAKNELRGRRMYVPDYAKSGELGESFAAFRRKNFGSFNLVSDPSAAHIIDVYEVMQHNYPQYFPDADSDQRRLQIMEQFMHNNPNARRERMMREDDVSALASELFNQVGNIAVKSEGPASKKMKSQALGDDEAPQDNVAEFSNTPPEIGPRVSGKKEELDVQGVIRRSGTEAKRYVDGLVKEKGVDSPSELAPGTVTRAQSKTDIRRRRSFGARVRDLMSHAYTVVVDDMHPFWNYTKAAEKSLGREQFGADNPYKLAINSKDASSRAAYIITDKLIDYNNKEIGSGLIETLENNGITGDNYSDFNAYLVARHALEWLDPEAHGAVKQVYEQPELNDMDVVQAMIDDFERKNSDFKKAAGKLYDWQRTMLKSWLLDTGVISQEQYDKFTEMYPNYVPFFREKDTSLGSAPAGGFANQGNIFKEAEGSRRRIYDPVENIMYNVATYVNHASKHGVTSAAVRLYDMLDDDPDHNILRQFWEEVEAIHPESDNPKYFKSKERTDKTEQKSDNTVEWDSLADVTQEKENSISQTLREQMTVHDNIVTIMDGGKKRYFRVDDPALLSLLDNARPGRFDGFLALMASFSRVRAALITSFNPAFALASNPVRDLGTLVLNSSDINKAKVIGRAATSYVDVFKNSQAYKSYLSMGGQYSSVTTEGTDAMKKAMNKLSAKDPSTVKRIFKGIASSPAKVFGAYQTLGDAIEASPRMSEFKSTLDKGYDYHEAFYRAKDVTTNFSRGGKISKELNAVSNFFNAAVQGVDKFFRQGKNNPASFAMGIAVLTALEAASWAWNTWNPFDDKDESYENLSNYTKNNFYTFYKGAGRFISFPKPRECAVLSTLIGASLQYCLNKQPERFRNFFSDYVIDQFIPDGSIAGYTTIQDLRANKDFMGRPIVPDNLAELPPELQYDDSTSYLARWTAGMVHKLPESIRDDLIESPMQIDHIINSELGVLGKINRTYAAPKKDKFGMITFGLNTTLSKDSLFSTDNLTIFYDNKNHAAAQAKGYPSSDNSWLSNRYTQASQVLSVINKIYKNDPEGENARAVRLQYSHYAKQYKDNPLGYSDDVYKELKSLADLVEDDNGILSLPQVKETIERTVNKKKISYTFDNAQSVINYQMDLNESVDREFRKLFTQVEFNALSTEDKLNELKKAKEDATKTVKDFYIDTKGGKRMFDESTGAKPTFVKPAVEAVTQYQEQQAFMNSINTDRLAPIAEALAKAVPDKAEQYTAESFKYSEVDSKSFDGKKYKISGELKEKINTEAESEYYSNIDKLLNNQINVEDIVGLTGKGNTKTSENAAGDKVSLSGKMYNEDGSPRFDELVTAKIIKAAESNIKDVVLQRYKDEIIAGEAAATATPEATDASEATAASAEKRVFGMADVNRLSNTFAAAFKSGTDEQRRIFGLPDTVQPQRIAFGYAPPIGKSTTQTAAAPAAATPIVAPQAQAGTTAIASAAPTKSSGSKRVYSSTSRKSSGTSAKRSSGRSSGGYSSSSLGSSVRALLSPVAEAAEISPNIAAASAAYSQAMSPYERIKTSFGIGTADRMKGIYQHFLDMLYGGTTIGEIVPGLKSVDVSGKAVNVEQLRLADCDEPTRQAVMQALQAQAEKEAVNETL